ncbi:hypothetical protein FQN54_002034 [Arachnomyces sp. PD_36]|nr:hypothetical protein FQN54_002034 [Arachnomyces sp. PD_36]
MSTQASQQPTIATTNSFPTPASSVSGQHSNAVSTEGADGIEKSAHLLQREPDRSHATDGNIGSDPMDIEQPNFTRTDHDRYSGGGEINSGLAGLKEQLVSKDENAMDLDRGTSNLAGGGPFSLESLQADMGSAFHLCKTSHSPSGPSPSFDLVSLYGLGPVAASVARTDPVTGEKINRLRKSYEGKLKGFGLAGRNKPVKHEPGAPGGLRHMTMWPEEEWQNQKVFGKEIKVADPDSAFFKLQMRAMKMEAGTVPNHEHWEDTLGHEKSSKQGGTPGDTGMRKSMGPSTGNGRLSQSNGTPKPTPVQNTDNARPRRAGKKRSYNDSSFVGYGEGYADDDGDVDVGFYSNSEEGGRTSGKKKRKKDHISGVSPTLNERSGSYGVGMAGVGAR